MNQGPHSDPDQAQRSALEKKAQEIADLKNALRQAEDKYRILVENANDAIFVLQDGRIRFANPKALALGGVLAEDLEKVPFSEYLHPAEKETVIERHEKRLQGEKILSMYPLRIITRKGDMFWAEVNAVRIDWEGRPATLNIIRDITSQKLFEEHYFQNESLANLRTLSGGMAHSINNLLMGIQGRVSLLYRSLGQDNVCVDHLQGIEACVADAAKLTRQMQGFAQSGKFNVTRVNMNVVIEEVAATFTDRRDQIALTTAFQPDLWPVKVDRQQMEQVVMNILLNAWQAISDKGEVIIKTENFELSEGREKFQDVRAGRCVKLTFRDTGLGMDAAVRKRVFQPFFTTKGYGRHRGLGLSCVYGIITNHDGMIDIDSIPGSGTTVYIYLPADLEESE
ncbi:MAG: PAS domain S-box protein [Desulfobacteraceae bacterium]|nr:MAG: PAS domain S-box protein [Desulfobacteraceae bacterium]